MRLLNRVARVDWIYLVLEGVRVVIADSPILSAIVFVGAQMVMGVLGYIQGRRDAESAFYRERLKEKLLDRYRER